jgi:hypothetical protein
MRTVNLLNTKKVFKSGKVYFSHLFSCISLCAHIFDIIFAFMNHFKDIFFDMKNIKMGITS